MFVGIFIAFFISLIPAYIASKKGRSFLLWWVYGFLLFIIALPHSLLIDENIDNIERKQLQNGMKKCLYCAEIIKADAVVCKFCGRSFNTNFPSSNQLLDSNPIKEWLKKNPNKTLNDYYKNFQKP